jgi:hypothetical protein
MTTTPTPLASAPSRTLSVLSLVAAIASIPLGHLIVLPVAAIILGFIARNREPSGRTLANWGIGLGFALLFWWVAVGALALTFWLPLTLLHIAH